MDDEFDSEMSDINVVSEEVGECDIYAAPELNSPHNKLLREVDCVSPLEVAATTPQRDIFTPSVNEKHSSTSGSQVAVELQSTTVEEILISSFNEDSLQTIDDEETSTPIQEETTNHAFEQSIQRTNAEVTSSNELVVNIANNFHSNVIYSPEDQNVTKCDLLGLLHEDILRYKIISYLDADSVLQLSSVSKEYREKLEQFEEVWKRYGTRFTRMIFINQHAEYLRNIYPKPFNSEHTAGIKNVEIYCPSNFARAIRYSNETRFSIFKRWCFLDPLKCFSVLSTNVILGICIYLLVLWGMLSAVVTPLIGSNWLLYILLALFFFTTIVYILFLCTYVLHMDYHNAIIRWIRRNLLSETQSSILYFCGVVQDYGGHNWNVAVVEFLVHLLWIPLLVLLYCIKAIAMPDSVTWTYWTIPAFTIWALYLLSTGFNGIMEFQKKKKPSRFRFLRYCNYSYFWVIFLFGTMIYSCLLGSALMLLGNLDGWMNVPWSAALAPIYPTLFLISIFLICFPSMNIFVHLVTNTKPKFEEIKLMNHVPNYCFSLTHILFNLSQEIFIIRCLSLFWPNILSLIFIGLKLDGVIDWHWSWILSPMPIWICINHIINQLIIQLGCGVTIGILSITSELFSNLSPILLRCIRR